MYLCPRARYAFHLWSLQSEHLYTLCTSSLLSSLFLVLLPLSPQPSFFGPFGRRPVLRASYHSSVFAFLVFRPHPSRFLVRPCVPFAPPRRALQSATSPARVEIHGDFNTFNFLIIRFTAARALMPRARTPLKILRHQNLLFQPAFFLPPQRQRPQTRIVAAGAADMHPAPLANCFTSVISPFISAYPRRRRGRTEQGWSAGNLGRETKSAREQLPGNAFVGSLR